WQPHPRTLFLNEKGRGETNLLLRHENILQLINNLVATGQRDAVNLVCDLFHVLHFFQFKQHGVFFHQFGSIQQASCRSSFFPSHDYVGLCFFLGHQYLVHNFFYFTRQDDISHAAISNLHTQVVSFVFQRSQNIGGDGFFFLQQFIQRKRTNKLPQSQLHQDIQLFLVILILNQRFDNINNFVLRVEVDSQSSFVLSKDFLT